MASTSRSKSTGRPTVKAAAKARPAGRTMRGLIKVPRPKAKPVQAARAKSASVRPAGKKRVVAKLAARKLAPARKPARKAATATADTRKLTRTATVTAKKLGARRSGPRSPGLKTATGGRPAARKSVAAAKKPTAKKSAAKAPTAKKVVAIGAGVKNAAASKPAARDLVSKDQPRARARTTEVPVRDRITEVPVRARTAEVPVRARTAEVQSPRVRPASQPETRPATDPVAAQKDLVAAQKEIAREYSATAVNRALSLLETLARTGPVPLAVLADAAGCGRTAAFELLSTMQTRNFVIQDESHGFWRLGARWAVLGSAASEQGALAATAMPYLAALGNATGENVYMRVREGMESETIAIYQTDPGLRVYTEVGKKMPLHAGSGRLLLAHAPEAVQTQVLAQRLQRYTPSTRTDPSWIAADLHRIRTRGFLITDSEVVAGTVSVCAPVRDASGQVVAAILIGAPSLRMRPPRPRALMPAVVEAARKLSHALGSISEQPAEPANGAMEARHLGAFSGPGWPATALGATISRPHSVFR